MKVYDNALYGSFNSMIVRLKDSQGLVEKVITKEFQFYDSPIKRNPEHPTLIFPSSFNSMIVRLKAVRNDKKHY